MAHPPSEPTESLRPNSEPGEIARQFAAQRSLREKPPAQIGPYRILETLGEGGMGVVYLAEQDKPIHRRVALKVIKLGMDTKATLARFETEREALALMNHAHVAKVLDAGATETGRPYFVMEHVAGIPITDYCDRHRLTTDERLALFAVVCQAVQHAHHKGIIHRDIKPTNVLVSVQDGTPIPKVIDFGVAKATQHRLTELTYFTELGQLIGTPGYMSPEQAEMAALDIDTRTDVYALGVMLYELLVGALPFDQQTLRGAGFAELQRIIREVEPSKPSTRLSSMGADSTSIAQKRKTEPQALVRQVRGDLDWIVMKCLEKDRTRRYETANALAQEIQRFLKREPVLAGPPDVRYRLGKFLRRRWRSVAVASMVAILAAVALALLVRSQFVAMQARQQRVTSLYYEALLSAYSREDEALKKLAEVSALAPEFLEARLQEAYLLHRMTKSDEARRAAEAIVAQHPDCGPAHLLLAALYITSDQGKSALHRAEGRRLVPNDRYFTALAMGPEEHAAAIDLLTSLLEENGSHIDARRDRAWRYFAVADYESMLEDAEFLTTLQPKSAAAWNTLGIAASRLRRSDRALEAYNRAILLSPDYAKAYYNRSDLLLNMNQIPKAMADCNRALSLQPEFQAARAQRAWLLLQSGRKEEAEAECWEIITADPQNAFAWHRLGNVLTVKKEYAKAKEAIEQGLHLLDDMGNAWADHAQVAYQLQRYDEALASINEALRLDPHNAVAWNRRGLIRHHAGELEGAESDLTRAIELIPDYHEALQNRARVRRARNLLDAAVQDHNRAIELSPTPNALAERGITYRFLGDDEAALRDFGEIMKRPAKKNRSATYLWMWEIHMLRGTSEGRDEAVRCLQSARDAADDDWEKQLVAAAAGEIDADALLSQARGSDQRIEALYTLGSRALVEGNHTPARRWFSEIVAAGAVDRALHDLAAMHLRRLDVGGR